MSYCNSELQSSILIKFSASFIIVCIITIVKGKQHIVNYREAVFYCLQNFINTLPKPLLPLLI